MITSLDYSQLYKQPFLIFFFFFLSFIYDTLRPNTLSFDTLRPTLYSSQMVLVVFALTNISLTTSRKGIHQLVLEQCLCKSSENVWWCNSFWTRLVVLNGPFGPVWCNLYYLVLLDPFGGAIFIFEWSFWASLVRSLTLNLFGPFGPVWQCDL